MDSFQSASAGPSNPPPASAAKKPGKPKGTGRGGKVKAEGGASAPAKPKKKKSSTSAALEGSSTATGTGASAAPAGAAAGASGSTRGTGRGRGRGRGAGSGGGPGSRGGRGSRGGKRGGRGRGAGRGGLARDSTVRRSESLMRAETVDGRASTVVKGGVAGTPAAEDALEGEEAPRTRVAVDDDDEEGEDEDEEGGLLEDVGEEEIKWREEMEKIRSQAMGPLIAAMSEEQYDRHESYRRAGFSRANLRRLINTHLGGGGTGSSVNPTITMAFGGVAKVFVGEIIEGARRLVPSLPEGAPLPPNAILESYRLYCQSHAESGALAQGRANPEAVNAGAGVGGSMGGRRRLF